MVYGSSDTKSRLHRTGSLPGTKVKKNFNIALTPKMQREGTNPDPILRIPDYNCTVFIEH
jgi:hypothetical protein